MIELKSAGEIAALREAGRLVARALAEIRTAAVVGVSLRELDEVAAGVIAGMVAAAPKASIQECLSTFPESHRGGNYVHQGPYEIANKTFCTCQRGRRIRFHLGSICRGYG